MGILDKLKELRGQSHMPHPVRRGPPALKTTSDISIAEGRYGVTDPGAHHIIQRLEGGGYVPDISVESLVDLQILNPQLKALKVEIVTGFRSRVKGITSKLFGERR